MEKPLTAAEAMQRADEANQRLNEVYGILQGQLLSDLTMSVFETMKKHELLPDGDLKVTNYPMEKIYMSTDIIIREEIDTEVLGTLQVEVEGEYIRLSEKTSQVTFTHQEWEKINAIYNNYKETVSDYKNRRG